MKLVKIGTGIVAATLLVSAQETQKHIDEKRVLQFRYNTSENSAIHDNMMFFSREFGDESKAIKNAPYSADSVTETTQVLADGNRISHKQTASTFRDSEGRTRREQSIDTIGSFSGKSMKLIHISDPVAGTSYTLDPETKVATKMPAIKSAMIAQSGHQPTHGESVVHFKQEIRTSGSAALAGVTEEIHKKLSSEAKSVANAKRESLGKQMMESVQVEGTRTTRSIAAGEIGNERPIDIVSERWYSPELQLTVMSRTLDPRSGETVFKLTNLRRAEPARFLFEVPADYKVNESGRFEMKVERKD